MRASALVVVLLLLEVPVAVPVGHRAAGAVLLLELVSPEPVLKCTSIIRLIFIHLYQNGYRTKGEMEQSMVPAKALHDDIVEWGFHCGKVNTRK